MSENIKPTFKDARTVKELLVQLRSEADLIATEILLQQSQFNVLFFATAALISVAALKSMLNFEVLIAVVAGGIIPLMMVTIAAAQKFFWFDKKSYATVRRDYMPASLEDTLDKLLDSQLKKIELLINHRDSIRVATVVLAFYLFFIGFGLGFLAIVEDNRPKLPTY